MRKKPFAQVICHGVPDAYELQEGDICNIDVTVYYDGHHGDLNETYYVGEVSVRYPKPPATTSDRLSKCQMRFCRRWLAGGDSSFSPDVVRVIVQGD